MYEFIQELRSLFYFDCEGETFYLFFLEFDESIRRKFSCSPILVLIFGCVLLVKHIEIELVDGANKVKGNILFFFHLELKDKVTLFIVE